MVAAASRRDARRSIARNSGGGGNAVRIKLKVSRWTCPHNPTRLGGTAEPAKRHQLILRTKRHTAPIVTQQVEF